MKEFPSIDTMLRWMQKEELSFASKCARAREVQGEMAADDHGDVINKCLNGELPTDVAKCVLSGLEWRAKKLQPKKYGDRTTIKNDTPSFQVIISDEKMEEQIDAARKRYGCDSTGGGD